MKRTGTRFSGKSDRDEAVSMLVPEAFFEHADNKKINDAFWGYLQRPPEINALIKNMAEHIKTKLYEFKNHFRIDLLLPENA